MSTLELEHLKHSSASGNNITLAADGSITVDTTTLKVDATSNTVGILNTAPGNYLDGELTIGNSTKDQYVNIVTGTANAAGLCFQDTTGTSIVSGLRYTHGDNKLGLWANGAERMSISADGAISKPNNPGFYARHTTARVYTNGYLYGFTITWEQGGSNLATATGIYTAPASGVYQVNLMLGNQYNSGAGNYKIYVNNSYYNGFTFDGIDNQSGWVTSTLCGLIKINANDTVRIWCNSTGHPDNSDWSAWSMYMVG